MLVNLGEEMKNLKKKISLALLSVSFIFLISILFFFQTLASPGLTCELKNVGVGNDCPSGVCVFSLNQATNSHAGNCSYGDFKVCCQDPGYNLISTVRTSDCLSTESLVVALNQELNSHAQHPQTSYNYRVCLNSTFSPISCVNRTNTCNLGETGLISLYQETNSHAANYTDTNYQTKICCSYGGCNNIGLQKPIINPATPDIGQAFTITCTANSNVYDCIRAYANGTYNNCTFDHVSGNDYVFNCSGMPDGNYIANCRSIPDTWANCCPASTIKSYSIVPAAGCTKDEHCRPYEICDCNLPSCSRHVKQDNTCYDFRPNCTACKYYDWCEEGMNPVDIEAYNQGLIGFGEIRPCCQDINNPGVLKECCIITGQAEKNCTKPNAVLNYLEANVTYDYCYNEECDMSGKCIDWDYRPHVMLPRC